MKTKKTLSAIGGTQLVGIFVGMLCVVGPVMAGTTPTNGVPEPGTMSLIALGAIGIAVAARKRRK